METRTLRGHHVLCVHGFRGMGYSPAFVVKMRQIVEEIRDTERSFLIRVVRALDDACGACPHNMGEGSCRSDEHVKALDRRVMEKLGIEHGQVFDKSDLVRLTAERVEPDDLDVLCKGCSWLSYGVCKEGLAQLKEQMAAANRLGTAG